MRVYAGMSDRIPLAETGGYAQRIEALGYDGLKVPETIHDSTMVAALALEHTDTLPVITSLTLAFPRSPLVLAYAAWDLQVLSGGRFGLGLATQIRPNIEDRYGVPWTDPVARMGEYVEAVRACFAVFQDGGELRYEGEHYRLTRLQPFFNPGPIDHPDIPIWMGGVNPGICRLGARLADGFVTHPTNSSPRFLRERVLPHLEGSGVPLVASTPVITGPTPQAVDDARQGTRRSFGFLYSTPAYWPTLELFGWREVGEQLRLLTRQGRWDEMSELVTDEMLDALVPQGTYDEIPDVIADWYEGVADGVSIHPPSDPGEDPAFREVIAGIRAHG